MVRHKNRYGYWEDLDSLPVRDCACNECIAAQRGQNTPASSGGVMGAIARGIAAAGIISAVGGAYADPQQSSNTAQQNYGKSSLEREGRRRGEQASDATRDQGYGRHNSSQEDDE